MAGLMTQAPAAPMGAPVGQPAPAQSRPMPKASPEETAQFHKLINNALLLIYSPRSFQAVLKHLGNAQTDPVGTLAMTAVTILGQLEADAGKKGKALSRTIVYYGLVGIVTDLGALAGKAGIHTYSQPEMDQALRAAVQLYQKSAGGQPQGQPPRSPPQQPPMQSGPAAAPQQPQPQQMMGR